MTWAASYIATVLRHVTTHVPNPPFRATGFRSNETGVRLRFYFDASFIISDDDIEEISIAITELIAQTSSNQDVRLTGYDLAPFGESQVLTDREAGFLLIDEFYH